MSKGGKPKVRKQSGGIQRVEELQAGKTREVAIGGGEDGAMLDGQGGQVGVRHIIVEGQGGSHILMPSAGHHDVKHFGVRAGWRRPLPFVVCPCGPSARAS